MPGQPLAVDHEEVKFVALQIGVREAARQFDLPEDTVKTWSRREGWLREQEEQEQRQQRVREEFRGRQGLNPIEPTASEILRNYDGDTRLCLAKGINSGAKHVSQLDGQEVLMAAGQVAQLAKSAALVGGWAGAGQAISLRLDVIAGCQDSGPVIDV